MKYKEITDLNIRRSKHEYIDSRWRGLLSAVESARSRVLNYLFVLNSGGLLATVTYVATKTKTEKIYFSIWSFVAGVIFITIHAAWDYYSCESYFRDFRKGVSNFFENEIEWEKMVDDDNRHGSFEWLFHVLGWASGVAFVIGSVLGICSV